MIHYECVVINLQKSAIFFLLQKLHPNGLSWQVFSILFLDRMVWESDAGQVFENWAGKIEI